MPVYELSSAGTAKTGRTLYTSMNANNQYGAMVPIASNQPSSGTGVVTFSNIPQIYQDLRMVAYVRDTQTGTDASTSYYYLNNNTGSSNYSYTNLYGNGTSAISDRATNAPYWNNNAAIPRAGTTTGTFGVIALDIFNYTNVTTFKTGLSRSACDLNGSGATYLTAMLWRQTAAINTISFYPTIGFADGTTVTLYGIRASNA